MKRKKFGFTIVEMMAVIGIIAILLGLLIPALRMVRNTAREAKQEAQLITIGVALTAFRNDDGDYPPSFGFDYTPPGAFLDYCGAQKLAEALLGRDLLGFNKYSNWSATDLTFYPTDPALLDASLDDRMDPYLELATTNAFRLGDLFGWTDVLEANTFVLCDVFGIPERRITLPNRRTVTPGTPILYYRANDSKTIRRIYNVLDNDAVVGLRKLEDSSKPLLDRKRHPLGNPLNAYEFFYGNPTDPTIIGYIQDPKVTATDWPYRPDSYILISAGADGFYGTPDDITNFGN